MPRAHTRRHDEHVVSRAHTTISTAVTHERSALSFGKIIRRRRVEGLRQISDDRHVVRHVRVRDLLTAAYAQGGPDWLAKLSYKLAFRDVERGKTMTRRDCAANFHDRTVWQQNLKTRERGFLDHGNIVVRVDNDSVFVNRTRAG